MLEFKIDKRPLSWNKSYSGIHWRERRRLAEEWKVLTKEKFKKLNISLSQIKFPLMILFLAISKKPIDSDNHESGKLIIDEIKNELKVDDSLEYIIISPTIPRKAVNCKECVIVRLYDQDEVNSFLEDLKSEIKKQ